MPCVFVLKGNFLNSYLILGLPEFGVMELFC